MIGLLERYSLVTTGGIFVTSFSENGDQLSQWRAYTGGLPGFSLGIPGGKLAEKVAESSHVLGRCSYDFSEAYRAATSIINYFADNFLSGDELMLDERSVQHEFARVVTLTAPLFKHRSFAEEEEWRIFSFLSFQDDRLNFREASGEIIPYIEFPISGIARPATSTEGDNFKIIPGPGQRYNPTAGQGLFWKYMKTNVAIGASEVPFRMK